ncbi:hypothetical protein PILCRDRAFT_607297 [Piloderma croceum F 1598]|uniref:Uncharacterized protein n=1 Tax=Piloderma croceum (strain F 1598) TaxID=765440 RepID=A0A0C3FDL7_PILCF|nr:hypothetical protein PILCRDRAFT_607297 [Piloderma croceum F 1598]
MQAASRKKETKEQRLARKGADQDHFKTLVTDLDGSFHQRQLSHGSLRIHDTVWRSWQEFAVTLGISPDISHGQAPPSEAHIKAFANYLAISTPGRIADDPVLRTIQMKMTTFMSTWTRRSSVQISKPVRQQVVSYLVSSEFLAAVQLSTASREKHVAHTIDIELLVEAMWEDETYFRNARERITSVCLTGIQSLTRDRPGAFTTHSSRPDCTDSIIHGHLDIRVHPNPDCPRSPFIFIIIKITDIKGFYKDDSVYKYVIFYPEPDESRSMCVVTSLLALLFMDDVFEHIHSPAELFHPEHPPLHAYSVPIKTEWLEISVFRRAQLDLVTRQWVTHPRDAISYSKYHAWLTHFSLVRGFHHPINPYCIRRSINSISATISVEDRDKIMTHKGPSGQMFVKRYSSNAVTVDVQSLQRGREEDRSSLQVRACRKHIKSDSQLTSPFSVRG